jgi:hypothetical protein
MTQPATTLDRFRRAGLGHLHGARRVLTTQQGKATEPALVPASAAYLAHVSIECAIKARLLARGGFASAEDLENKQPQVYSKLFKGKSGHDLSALAGQLRLKNLVENNGKSWADDACWRRMASSARPYSLRYGMEPIERPAAEQEVQRATELLGVLLDGLPSVPLYRNRKGAR